jgi:hypothetical protein
MDLAIFTHVIKLKPNFAEAYINRSFAWHAKGDDYKADLDFQKFAELHSKRLQSKQR